MNYLISMTGFWMMLFVVEVVLHILKSRKNAFTKFTKAVLDPTSYLSEAMARGKRKWWITLIITILLFSVIIGASFSKGAETVSAAIDNIPLVSSITLFYTYLFDMPFSELAFLGINSIISVLAADCINSLIVGEDEGVSNKIFVLGYGPLLIITSVISTYLLDMLSVKSWIEGMNASGGFPQILLIIFIYLAFLFLITYAEEILVFIGIITIIMDVYYGLKFEKIDEFFTQKYMASKGYTDLQQVADDISAIPAIYKVIACLVIIILARLVERWIDKLIGKIIKEK